MTSNSIFAAAAGAALVAGGDHTEVAAVYRESLREKGVARGHPLSLCLAADSGCRRAAVDEGLTDRVVAQGTTLVRTERAESVQ